MQKQNERNQEVTQHKHRLTTTANGRALDKDQRSFWGIRDFIIVLKQNICNFWNYLCPFVGLLILFIHFY